MKTKINKKTGIGKLEKYPLHKMELMDSMDLPAASERNAASIQRSIYTAIRTLKESNPEIKFRSKITFSSKKGIYLRVCRIK